MLLTNEPTAEEAESTGYVSDLVPEIAAMMSSGQLVSREKVEEELDDIIRTVREFWHLEPDQVMYMISVLSARLSDMEVQLHRAENARGVEKLQWKQIRTMQVQVLIKELDRQFKVHSRVVELRRQDLQTLR